MYFPKKDFTSELEDNKNLIFGKVLMDILLKEEKMFLARIWNNIYYVNKPKFGV